MFTFYALLLELGNKFIQPSLFYDFSSVVFPPPAIGVDGAKCHRHGRLIKGIAFAFLMHGRRMKGIERHGENSSTYCSKN